MDGDDAIGTLDAFIASVFEAIDSVECHAKVEVACPLCGHVIYAEKSKGRHCDVYCPHCHIKLAV